MRLLRSTWVLRLAACLLFCSLVPSVLGPVALAAQADSAESYAAWLRSELAYPEDPAAARALEAAAGEPAASFDAFVRVFASAYEAQRPSRDLASLFSAEARNTEALVRYLYGRYSQLLSAPANAQGTISASTSALAGVTKRAVAVLPVSSAAGLEPALHSHLSEHRTAAPSAVPVRILSAAQPLGP